MRTCNEIAFILEEYLKTKKISLRQFANLIDYSHSAISSWKKKDTVLPSIEIISKIAKFMNVSLDWLVNGDENIIESIQEPEDLSYDINTQKKLSSDAFLSLLDKLLEERNLSKNQLCSNLNITRSAFTNWKLHNSLPSSDTLLKLANFFKVDPYYLVFGIENHSISERERKRCYDTGFYDGQKYILEQLKDIKPKK